MQGDEALHVGGVTGWLRSVRDGLKAAVTTRPGMPAVVGGVWFVLAFGLVLWMWGLNPLVFPSPDEAVVRYSAQLIGERGDPF